MVRSGMYDKLMEVNMRGVRSRLAQWRAGRLRVTAERGARFLVKWGSDAQIASFY